MRNGVAGIGQAIAFAALVAAATVLEIYGKEASGLWIIVIVWVLFADWRPGKNG